MTEHTKEPWRVVRGEITYRSDDDDQSFGMNCPVDIADDANARRIVACVNACRGIRTEALEHRVHALAAEDDTISLLMAQRDQLLAALEAIIDLHDSARRGSDVAVAIGRARQAIDAVKGD